MRPSRQDLLARWLAAERDDRTEDAEAALLALCEELPRLQPPAGFADRVLARAAVVPATVRRSLFASRWSRVALAFTLLVTGISMLWLPATVEALAGLWSLWSVGGLVRLWTAVVAGAAEGMASLAALGEWLFTLGRALAIALARPRVAQVLVVCFVVSTLAFRFLRDLITRERRWIHVQS